jgi:hypothetical protein
MCKKTFQLMPCASQLQGASDNNTLITKTRLSGCKSNITMTPWMRVFEKNNESSDPCCCLLPPIANTAGTSLEMTSLVPKNAFHAASQKNGYRGHELMRSNVAMYDLCAWHASLVCRRAVCIVPLIDDRASSGERRGLRSLNICIEVFYTTVYCKSV